jgi:hypothetical protein
MTLEGVLRQSWLVAGVHHDKQVWAILAPEWRALNAPGGAQTAQGVRRDRRA